MAKGADDPRLDPRIRAMLSNMPQPAPNPATTREEMVARAPTELTTQVMQVRHHALKNDMEAQMRRIAEGREAAVSALRSWAGGERLGCARPPR